MRQDFILDPPVGPDSSPALIRAWIRRLEQIRRERADEPDLVRIIDLGHDRAQAWLERSPPQ